MPFNAPAKYYDLYDDPITDEVPHVVVPFAHELRAYSDIPSEAFSLSEEKTLELIRGYMAATSYMDAQVGRVLDQLDTLGLTEKTVVLLCGDHGFHLGEHAKLGGRIPCLKWHFGHRLSLAFRDRNRSVSKPTHLLNWLISILLCVMLCQLPIPEQLEGLSMVPVIREPTTPLEIRCFQQNWQRIWETLYTDAKVSIL